MNKYLRIIISFVLISLLIACTTKINYTYHENNKTEDSNKCDEEQK